MPNLNLRDVFKTFGSAPRVEALKRVSLNVEQGDFIAIEGPSGGGKSTLLNIIGLLDSPTEGRYSIEGRDTEFSSSRLAAEMRSDYFGFIFQSFHLLDRRPVIDSVELGLLYRAVDPLLRTQLATDALVSVGLGDAVHQKANTLSGGERQRVAIARALATQAPIIVADEPTGNLDSANSESIVAQLEQMNGRGITVILVTHSSEIAGHARRRVAIKDGEISWTPGRSAEPPLPSVMDPVGTHHVASVPPGRASRVRWQDLIRDAWANSIARRVRTGGLITAVAVAVALTVTTLGLSASAGAQVSDRFNAQLNREVTVSYGPDQLNYEATGARDSIVRRIAAMPGVDSVAIVTAHDEHQVQASPSRAVFSVPDYSIAGDAAGAAVLHIDWVPGMRHQLSTGQILLGKDLADQMDLGPLEGGPGVRLDGTTVLVAGIIISSQRVPDYLGGILSANEDSKTLGDAQAVQVLIRTRAGAAQAIAKAVPLVIDPARPEGLQVDAPTDPSKLRQQVEGSVQSTLIALTSIALLASIAGLANSMMLAVIERKQELGLRRAIGARPRHVAMLIFVESAIVGFIGGLLGLGIGLIAVFSFTIARHWIPVFDIRLAPLAVVGGIVIGVLGGLLASFRASHIEPSEALRT